MLCLPMAVPSCPPTDHKRHHGLVSSSASDAPATFPVFTTEDERDAFAASEAEADDWVLVDDDDAVNSTPVEVTVAEVAALRFFWG